MGDYLCKPLDEGYGRRPFSTGGLFFDDTLGVIEATGTTHMPGMIVPTEGDPADDYRAVDEAHDAARMAYDFYKIVLDRKSINDRGLDLISSVDCLRDFDNAFWNRACSDFQNIELCCN